MKAKKIVFGTLMCLIGLLFLNFNSNGETQKKYLTVRAYEYSGGLMTDNKIIVTNEEGKTQELNLEKWKGEGFKENSIKITAILNALSGKGYDLLSSSVGAGDVCIVTTFVFIKSS